MKKTFLIIFSVVCVGAIYSTAVFGSDGKTYTGAQCQFIDNVFASHSRNSHRFTNNSGYAQTVMCPIVRDKMKSDLEWSRIEIDGFADPVRFVERNYWAGGMYGIDYQRRDFLDSKGFWFYRWGDYYSLDYSAYAIEMILFSGSSIQYYVVQEK